jgi:excisionase family DNA binding protein
MVRTMSEELITREEACRRLAISKTTLHRMVNSGELELVKLGPSRQSASRIRASGVERIIAEGVSKPEPLTTADVPEYQPLSWR